MDVFKYGPAFFAINEFHFSHYKKCTNSEEMEKMQEYVIEELLKAKLEVKNTEIDYGDKASNESEGTDSEEERLYYE